MGVAMNTDESYFSTQFYDSTATDASAMQQCAKYIAGLNLGSAEPFHLFYVPAEASWHCDAANEVDCTSPQANADLAQYYSYNPVGAVCPS